MSTECEIPAGLRQAILRGNCVAFVGAGFSACVVPTWKKLLSDIALDAPSAEARSVQGLLDSPAPRDLDYVAAAEILRDVLGPEELWRQLQSRLSRSPDPGEGMQRRLEAMQQRLRWLRGIPFRAVLTTNFDGLLPGALPCGDSYASVLKPTNGDGWASGRFWGSYPTGPQVVKLHGDVNHGDLNDLVLSRRDYRRRLYSEPAYGSFLRAVLASTTVLYLGYSFSDAYLNELRSETLALFSYQPKQLPLAYAVAADVSETERRYFERHEGIAILAYQTDGEDFSGFDTYLEMLYRETNPQSYLGRLLSGRRIVWLDPRPQNNVLGMEYLQQATAGQQPPCRIDLVRTWEEALVHLKPPEPSTDLVITHWGYGRATDSSGVACSTAERLLFEIRRQDVRVPVIVFSGQEGADQNRITALKHGALAFTFRWETLFREIAEVFQPGQEAG
jgi:hypothetical protein